MNRALSKPQATADDMLRLDMIRRETQQAIAEADAAGNEMVKALAVSRGMRQLRDALTDELMPDVMELMNSKLGFDTDRNPAKSHGQVQPYAVETVRECLIHGLMLGVQPVGNQMNIIGGNCYVTREGCEYLVAHTQGLTDLRLDVGVPAVRDGGALVSAWASWRYCGKPDSLACELRDGRDTRICIRVNKGQGADAILGKAKRKLLARVLERIKGSSLGDDDGVSIAEENPLMPAAEHAEPATAVDVAHGLLADAKAALLEARQKAECMAIGERAAKQMEEAGLSDDDLRHKWMELEAAVEERCQQIQQGRDAS